MHLFKHLRNIGYHYINLMQNQSINASRKHQNLRLVRCRLETTNHQHLGSYKYN